MIKKLAEQSGSTHKQNLGVYQFYTDELEKFAELIIDECCDRMEYIDERVVPRPTWQLYEHFDLDWQKDCHLDSYGVWRKNGNKEK